MTIVQAHRVIIDVLKSLFVYNHDRMESGPLDDAYRTLDRLSKEMCDAGAWSRDSDPRTFRSAFGLGEVVYQRVTRDSSPGMVTGVKFSPGQAVYLVTWGNGNTTELYEMELSREYVPEYAKAD